MVKLFLVAALLLAACGDGQRSPPRDSVPAVPDTEQDTIYVDSTGDVSMYSHAAWKGKSIAPNLVIDIRLQTAGDSGTYRVHYSLADPLQSGDTVQLRLSRDSIANYGKMAVLIAKRTSQRDSANFKVQRVYGASVKWYACRRLLRAGTQIIPERCTTWRTNLPPRQPDSVWVDSMLAVKALDAKPDTIKITEAVWKKLNIYKRSDGQLTDSLGRLLGFTCPAGAKCPKVQVCGFVIFKDNKVAMRDSQAEGCAGEYAKLPAAKRTITGEQQLVANAVCIKWDATGGTIEPELCPGQPAWLRQFVPTFAFGDTVNIKLEAPPLPPATARTRA